MADPWDAFGEEDDADEEYEDKTPSVHLNRLASDDYQDDYAVAVSVLTALVQRWINHGDVLSLQYRRVLLLIAIDDTSPLPNTTSLSRSTSWKGIFALKNIKDVTVIEIPTHAVVPDQDLYFDAVIWILPSPLEATNVMHKSSIGTSEAMLIPGGYLLFTTSKYIGNFHESDVSSLFSASVWDFESAAVISLRKESIEVWLLLSKWPCVIDSGSCKWLSSMHSTENERRLLSTATISLSVHERKNGCISPTLLNKVVMAIRHHGYCIVSGLLYNEKHQCLEYGTAAMSDIQAASTILKKQEIDLFQPSLSLQEPGAYRELSMREHCRIDIRHGPTLNAARGPGGDASITYNASTQGNKSNFLRGNNNILSIVRRAMNPPTPKDRSVGNYGRYNFDGSGPDGSDRDLVCGPVGAIVNLPGSADQSIHADTPHLFEHIINPSPLPPHYINVFTLGCLPVNDVGQTAFIHGSHCLEFASKHIRQNSTEDAEPDPFLPSLWDHLVRPRMDLGDVLLFDCRILHFGLSNRHKSMARPMLYANMTLHWFNDPKNWDDNACIFESNS